MSIYINVLQFAAEHGFQWEDYVNMLTLRICSGSIGYYKSIKYD